jgi:hypothetical protein
MNIYDVGNKSHVGFWCAAPDPETAIDIALAAGHGKARSNLRAIDVTLAFRRNMERGHLGIAEILAGDETGRVIGRANFVTMEQILRGEKAAPTRWEVVRGRPAMSGV